MGGLDRREGRRDRATTSPFSTAVYHGMKGGCGREVASLESERRVAGPSERASE